jgi:hypothetical protein
VLPEPAFRRLLLEMWHPPRERSLQPSRTTVLYANSSSNADVVFAFVGYSQRRRGRQLIWLKVAWLQCLACIHRNGPSLRQAWAPKPGWTTVHARPP